MINDIADGVSIERLNVMESYDPADLEGNVRVFDNGLKQYLEEYEKAGISPIPGSCFSMIPLIAIYVSKAL